ncbi:TonB-dependent receptor [Tanticharoenia sakaeratensis]|uniref:TonB-dependent receptor n=1 Tax=Tanticharoenia sakaeratensis TaxID=444053 RepID=UPI0009FBDBEB
MISRVRRHAHTVSLVAGAALACHAVDAQADQTETVHAKARHVRHRAAHKASHAQHDAKQPAAARPAPKAPAPARVVDDHTIEASPDEAEDVLARGDRMDILHSPMGLSRMPQDVLHTPQTINVVPQALMQQQNVKSLDEALRNVPGITASVGEGEGGMAGDQFLIRGFQAQNDIYEDGLRDFGVYTRDSFDYDHVSVIKGPSSEVFGNGTTGGAINITTKVAHLGDSYSGSFSGGSADYYRGTFDINKQINDTTAVRIAGMGNENNEVGRDDVYSHRWGIAPSIAFGLGKRTTFTLEYLHQSDNRIPDYGVPVITRPGATVGEPATAYGINRNNWYGTTYDQDDSSVDMLTGRLKFDLNPHITLYDDLRGGMYSRYFSASQEGCGTTCEDAYFSGDDADALVDRRGPKGGPQPYQQNDWSVQNVFSGVANFNTGPLRHQMIGGVDVEHVYDRRTNYAYNFNGQNGTREDETSLVSPSSVQPGLLLGGVGQYAYDLTNISGAGQKLYKTGDATDVGVFFSEQMWIIPSFSIRGGVRWDNWNSHYSATEGATSSATRLGQQQNTVNPTVSLMYTPDKTTMIYFNWAESTTPLGLYVTNSSEPLSSTSQNYSPERSRLYELGVKRDMFNGRLGLTASIFRLEKDNSLLTDPTTGSVTSSSDQQRNQGVELSASGEILRNWNVIATYAYYDPKTTSSLTKADIGKQIAFAPRNSATFWSTYSIAPHTPWNVTFGGGLTWRDRAWLNAANTAYVPHTMEWDAVISHNIGKHWRFALNGYNLANRLNYSNLFSGRATPSTGRAFLGNLSLTY